jgi:release factor glutamine methyltransferase
MGEAEFLASPDKELSPKAVNAFFRLIDKRLSGVPLAHITGKKEFWSMSLKIRPGVFIPRPETELLVEKVLELSTREHETIVDIGTGSGNVAIALARELPNASIIATEICGRTLRVAEINAENIVPGRIIFLRGSLFSALKNQSLEEKCDFIVSNPPYVSAADWEILPSEVKDHEPRRALVGGKTGLEFLRRLIRGSLSYLKPGAFLLSEIGQGQDEEALSLFDKHWGEKEVFNDLRDIPRVVKARRASAY